MIRSVVSNGRAVRSEWTGPYEEYDVIVAGGGTAGAIAAIVAAEHGMKTLVVERSNCCGGIGTGGLVTNYYYGIRHGRHTLIDAAVKERENGSGYILRKNCFSAELKKIELEQTMLKAGVEIRYEAVLTAVLMRDESTVNGVFWHDADGEHCAACRYVIDATAEAQVVFLAGGAFHFGRESDGLAQTYTLNYSRSADNTQLINFGDGGYVNPSDSSELTDEILRQSAALYPDRFTAENRIDFFSGHFCAREGRLIAGEENLTLEDVIHGRLAAEPVAWERSNWDTHTLDLGFEDDTAMQWGVAAMQWSTVLHIPVPRGALIPKGLHGILVAGRMLAVDHNLSQAVRMKDCMQFTGEAAAVMASLAVKRHCDVREVPYQMIAGELSCGDYSVENEKLLLKTEAEILNGLRSGAPGQAIWSAYRMGNRAYLKTLLGEPGPACAHAAFALALLKEKSCLGILRELAEQRNSRRAETPRSEPHRQEYGAIAAYLLGWMGDAESVDLLIGILKERRSAQYAVNALNALMRIGEETEDLRQKIGFALSEFAGIPQNPLTICCFGSSRPLNILNRMRILICARLDKWGIHHYVETVLNGGKLTQVERNMWRRLYR